MPGSEGLHNANTERQRAAEHLRRTSLAADPTRGRRNTIFTAVGVAVLVLSAGAFWAMRHGSDAPASFSEKPKIDENPGKVAPLDPSRQPLPASMASAASAASPAVTGSTPVDPDEARRAAQRQQQGAAEAARKEQKEEALRQARLHSDVFDGESAGEDSTAATASNDEDKGDGSAINGRRRHGGDGPNDPNTAFARVVADADDSAQKAQKIDNLQCKILPGRILEGKMQQRIISDLPGSITILLDRDTFGEQGRIPLMPWGTVITGKPNSVVRKGQERVFIASATAYRPDGVNIHIDSPVADQLGSAGIDGEVDNHVGQILGMSAALSLLGAGASTYGASSSDGNNSIATYRQGVQSSFAQSSSQLLEGYVNIPPTIKADQGTRVRIQVERVLDFSDYCKPTDDEE
ncbi:Inner membrane protein of type IV secretion of T-DNA complex, TonB-like, VirB10 [Caballeronia sordidicola]|uniref:Inner membrane protein of type IV secretion of T-DNA complex, TonB-like, VirB10 n=1 Tax=Caballeronia sordidicola TaxID=196367 RepID=A0A242N4C0_CABSO|nr:Inner membrane protein of type IV secretion of T-DNA complex, TonB-like, VirB10 [Caballeronia sordidicola]